MNSGKKIESWQKNHRIFNCILKKNLSFNEETNFFTQIRGQPYNVFSVGEIFTTPYCVIRYYFYEHLGVTLEEDFNLYEGWNNFSLKVRRNGERESWNLRILC